MVAKTIEICGRPVRFCASASTPRLYRLKFKRDIFADMQKLTKDFQAKKAAQKAKAQAEDMEQNAGTDLAVESLEIFENVAYDHAPVPPALL